MAKTIILLEYDLSSYGGRHITFIDGFLDCFLEMGYKAKIYGRFTGRLVNDKDELVKKSMGRHVKKTHISFRDVPTRSEPNNNTIRLLNSADYVFSVAHYDKLSRYVETPMIYWIIAKPPPERVPKSKLIWTNSHHQKKEIELSHAEVIYPPHDYSRFRQKAKPWGEREIDILLTTGVRKAKIGSYLMRRELRYTEKLAKKFNVVGLFACRTDEEYAIVERLPYETHINVSRTTVPKYMGNAKIFLHPSPLECAALVAYESLNAGCYPVFRRAGACEEQLGRVGIIYDELPNVGFWQWIKNDIMGMDYNINWSINQGKKFDRKPMMKKIEKYLSKIADNKRDDS